METQQNLLLEMKSSVDKENSSRFVFEQLVNETIDNVFSSLGTACKQTIYDYLEKKYELKKNDLADHTMEFSEALDQIFGGAGALLEIQIMKKLYRKAPQFKHRPKVAQTFPDYINALSRFIRRQNACERTDNLQALLE